MPPDTPSIGSPLLYSVFLVAVLLMLGIDIVALNKRGDHRIGMREALLWTLLWVALSTLFAAWLGWTLSGDVRYGPSLARLKVLEFFTGYLIEKALAVDNIFVFLMIFAYFRVPPEYQRRVLLYGVFGAIVLRALMVGLGTLLISRFAWVLYVFGGFLLLTGVKMLRPEAEEQKDLADNVILRFLRARLRLTTQFHGERFFVREGTLRHATPMFLVLVMIELSDVIFAVDSIPAIFAITADPFIVLSSNIFAILGLRAMYFLLAGAAERFYLLRYGLAAVLVFIGAKMLIVRIVHIPVAWSLLVVFVLLAASILASLARPRHG